MSQTKPSRGFTLIEILVVIGIVAVLIGILIPVLSSARKTAKSAVCMSNMRQLATATTSYQNDNNRHFPQPSRDNGITSDPDKAVWYNALDYYVGNSPKSGATNDRNDNAYKQDPIWFDAPNFGLDLDNVRTIKMNEFLGWIGSATTPPSEPTSPNPYKFYRGSKISKPSQTVLYVDGRAHDTPSATSGNIDSGGTSSFSAREIFVGLRHDNGANVTKTDASVGHHTNPINETGSGYQGWYDNDDNNPDNRPDVLFNFDDRSSL